MKPITVNLYTIIQYIIYNIILCSGGRWIILFPGRLHIGFFIYTIHIISIISCPFNITPLYHSGHLETFSNDLRFTSFDTACWKHRSLVVLSLIPSTCPLLF